MSTTSQAWNALRWTKLAVATYGAQAVAVSRDFEQLIALAASRPDPKARLLLVNDFFNQRLHFVSDLDAWGEVDYWASPMESLFAGKGDCEDYAIAKYFALLASGISVHHLRLVYVQADLSPVRGEPGRTQPHMVLIYNEALTAEDPWVLDNLVQEIQPASLRTDLKPVFSFSSEGLWDGVRGARAGDATAQLSRWRRVLTKALAEGF